MMIKKLIKWFINYFSLMLLIQACSSTSTVQHIDTEAQSDSLNKAYGLLYYKEGIALLGSKRYEESLASFKNAHPHVMNPRVFNAKDRAALYNAYGKAFFYLNQNDSAKHKFEYAVVLNPGYAEAYNNLGYLAFMKRNIARATELYKKALSVNPNYAIAKENLELLESFENGKVSWNAYGLFEKAQKIQNIEEQIRIYTRIIEEFPLYSDAYNNLAVALYQTGDFEKALTLLKQLILIDKNYAMAHNNLGYLYLELGFTSQAIEEFLIATSLKKDFTLAIMNLATAYFQNADYGRAKTYVEKVLAIEPRHVEAWRVLKLCEEMITSENKSVLNKEMDNE